MNEKIITLDSVDLVTFYGINNKNLNLIKKKYPDVNITARGEQINLSSENEEDLNAAFDSLKEIFDYLQRNNKLPDEIIENQLNEEKKDMSFTEKGSDFILKGRNGKVIKARTPNQFRLVRAVDENDIVFAIGPAGTGKTYTSVALAVRALKNKQVKKIILTRPAVEAGESLGFLPGDMREKIDPYLRPLYDALDDMLSGDKYAQHLERKVIEIAPLAFMRGRTLDNAFVILDEAQNCTELQLKMFLTRMGPSAKFIVNGDLTQIDLPNSQRSGLVHAIQILKNINGIDVLEFNVEDVTRHKIVKEIVRAYSLGKKV